jgi:hypothetical protein
LDKFLLKFYKVSKKQPIRATFLSLA